VSLGLRCEAADGVGAAQMQTPHEKCGDKAGKTNQNRGEYYIYTYNCIYIIVKYRM